MVKGLVNAMGLKPGDTILDPMMGSGTVLIEARLMGIKSVGLDASPFCRFMTQAKLDALTVPLRPVRAASKESRAVFEYFTKVAGRPEGGSKARYREAQMQWFLGEGDTPESPLSGADHQLPEGCEVPEVYNLLLLAYLDSAGYAERSNRKAPYDQFRAVLERYLFVCEKIQRVLSGTESELAEATALEGDARSLPLPDRSVDGVLFSPPYSFAIDYLENDSFHLGFLGVDTAKLREKMVGLRGKTLPQKYELYRSDMDKVLSECARVLRPGRVCTVVVGTNNNQLSKALGVAPDAVPGTDELLAELATSHGLRPVRKLSRQITGIANTMRSEYILMLQRR
jgi:SAM-dependent methyltransferase